MRKNFRVEPALELEDVEVSGRADRQDVDGAHRGLEFNPVAACRVDVEPKPAAVNVDRRDVLRQEIPQLVFEPESLLWRSLSSASSASDASPSTVSNPRRTNASRDQPHLGRGLLDRPPKSLIFEPATP